MAMIFQNPRAALNSDPRHRRPDRRCHPGAQATVAALKARDEALQLLRASKSAIPKRRMSAYPHELSGGMCQRVMIAMAISCHRRC